MIDGRAVDEAPRSMAVPAPVVERAAMLHRWQHLAFIHWPYRPAEVAPLLPPGLTLDTFDGAAWIGLIPFHLTITVPHLPTVPWAARTPEMNIRTYVRGPRGEPGLVFLSLDAARLGLVVGARALYQLPYHWAKMQFSKVGTIATYRTRRRLERVPPADSEFVVDIGDAVIDLDELDQFLTTRWTFFCSLRRGLCYAHVAHNPWPLRRGRLVECRDGLIEALGLPRPKGEAMVHYSDSIDVRMGWPQRASGPRPAPF